MQQLAASHRCPSTTAVSVARCRQQPAACLRSPSCTAMSARSPCVPARRRVQQQQQRERRHCVVAAASASAYGSEWSTPDDAYVTVGLAHCFVKGGDGKLVDQFVIEPITANSLECMQNGGKTSFLHVFSLRLGEALRRTKAVFPAEFSQGAFCEEYEARCDACARTWMRPHALDNLLDIVPLGQLKSSFNFSTSDKRVLNAEHIVNDDDNIKQDMSIDVYGRSSKEDAAAQVAGAAAPAEEEEDDMDALLSV